MQIVHIDMDAFFASVEELDNPELKNKPVIVGGQTKSRGVVAAANYQARQFGVHSAMPMALATRLCPKAVLVTPRHQRYVQISNEIRKIFNRYTPVVQPLSLDEAFLDLNSSVRLFGPVIEIAQRIKKEIFHELKLTASVGIAPNKFLAKLASDADKPDGFVVVNQSEIQSFLDPMPVTQLWGVGHATARKLERNAIFTVAHLREKTRIQLKKLFGENQALHLWNLARGIDERDVVVESTAKSISREITFEVDKDDPSELNRVFLHLTENVCSRMRVGMLSAKTIRIKYRRHDFKTFSRSISLQSASNQTQVIWHTVKLLIDRHINNTALPLRLIGVSLSNFERQFEHQGNLFDQNSNTIDDLSDRINQRFGEDSLARAKGILKNDKSD